MIEGMAAGMLNATRARQRLAGLYARHGGRLPQAVAVLLMLWLAHQAAGLVWILLPLPDRARWQPPLPAPAPSAARAQADPLTTLRSAELFGAYRPAAAPSITALANAPETNLNLNLLGILADRTRPRQSRAVIAGGPGGEKPYSLGDAVGSGVTLRAIFPDRVVLSRNGGLETLRLDKTRPSAGGDLNTPIAVAGQAGANTGAAKLTELRSELLANPNKVGNYIRVEPMKTAGGGQLGYRIYPGPNTGMFQAAGLRPGDLVTAVNGVPLTDPGKTLQLLSQLSNAGQVTLTVQRAERTQTVTLNFAQ
ncbi:MAG: type II secretion system protein GspC [Gammaproteobacteria bacterium]|nr:type II secretion system protein GspC [Gammaproteobacteria bacterium]